MTLQATDAFSSVATTTCSAIIAQPVATSTSPADQITAILEQIAALKAQLKPRDTATWTLIDGKIDTVLRELRAVNPNVANQKTALEALLAVLK